LNWKQVIVNLIGYVGIIVVGIVTQFTTKNTIATFAITFIIGFAIRRFSGWLATNNTTRNPKKNSSWISRFIRDRRRKSSTVNNLKREPRYSSKQEEFELSSYKVKYLGGDESVRRGKQMTLIIEREGIMVPELKLRIGYDRIQHVELVTINDLKSSKFFSVESVSTIIILGVMSLVIDYLRGRERVLKLTSSDENGNVRTHIFSLKKRSEVQSTISNRILTMRNNPVVRTGVAPVSITRVDLNPVISTNIPPKENHLRPNPPNQPYVQSAERSLPSLESREKSEWIIREQAVDISTPPILAEKTKPKKYTTAVLMTAYQNMKMQHEQGLITEESYSSYVQGLKFRDETGNLWIIAKGSGIWYTNKGQSWNPGNPQDTLYKIS
jgi:hypothetical protein